MWIDMFLRMARAPSVIRLFLRVVVGLTAELLVEIAVLIRLAAMAFELADVQHNVGNFGIPLKTVMPDCQEVAIRA
jgi:hypothetical protein